METLYILTTVLLSSAMAGCVTYYLNVSKDRHWHIGAKAEELYCAVQSLERELTLFFGINYSCLGDNRRGSETEKEALQRAGAHLVIVKMLVGFYFPALSSALTRAIVAVIAAHNKLKDYEKADVEDKEDLLILLDNAVATLKDSLEALKLAVIEKGRRTDNSPLAFFWRPMKPMNVGRVARAPA